MFERFTERARQVVTLSQEEARLLHHRTIGTEHLLLGLLREEQGLAAQALNASGVWLEPTRAAVAGAHEADSATDGVMPFTPDAKRVLERSLREAVRMSHNYIGTEHLLLGLLREREAIGFRVLIDVGADPEEVRSILLELLGTRPERRALPHAPDVAAALARAADAAREEGADHVELRHLRQVLEGP